jgi:hypothetical protein
MEIVMFSTAEDWLARFKEAGCTLRIDDSDTLRPLEDQTMTPKCESIWSEIRGSENREKWIAVTNLVKSRVGPIRGWVDY